VASALASIATRHPLACFAIAIAIAKNSKRGAVACVGQASTRHQNESTLSQEHCRLRTLVQLLP